MLGQNKMWNHRKRRCSKYMYTSNVKTFWVVSCFWKTNFWLGVGYTALVPLEKKERFVEAEDYRKISRDEPVGCNLMFTVKLFSIDCRKTKIKKSQQSIWKASENLEQKQENSQSAGKRGRPIRDS